MENIPQKIMRSLKRKLVLKDKFSEGIDFPTNGSIHGLPVINGSSFQTTNWQQAYPNMVRFKSDENDDQLYQSIIASPIIVDSESKGSIVLLENILCVEKTVFVAFISLVSVE